MFVDKYWVYWICWSFTKPKTPILNMDYSWNILNPNIIDSVHPITSWHGWVSRRSCCCSSSSDPTSEPLPLTWGTWRHPHDGPPTSGGLGSSLGGWGCPWWIPTGECLEALEESATVSSLSVFKPQSEFSHHKFFYIFFYHVCFSLQCNKCCRSVLCSAWVDARVDVSVHTLLFLSWCVSLST